MKIGLLTRNAKAWCSAQLVKAIQDRGLEPFCFGFKDIIARVAYKIKVGINDFDAVNALKAIIVRPIGRGSLDEIIYRLDLLHRMERLGVPVINSPLSIEKAVDKFYALTLLEEKNISVPPKLSAIL